MKTRIALAGIAVAALALAGCSSDAGTDEVVEVVPEATTDADGDTIVDVAAGNDDFSTLVAAVTAADLGDTLSGEGPFTVFAPTNEAFDALPDGVVNQLLLPSNKDALTSVLTYHVVAGEVLAADVTPGDVASVEGQDLTLTTDDGGVQVNGVPVETADLKASNGVIHVIGEVLLPPDFDPATLATS